GGAQLRHHRHRALLNLGGGLKQAHAEAHQHRGADRRQRRQHHQQERFTTDREDHVLGHGGHRYPRMRPRASSPQPSMATNKRILNGRLTWLGESVCIPSASKTLAITMSSTRNGRKMRKPISNASFSSVITNVGGACCEPIAERASESTTTIFEKLVSIMIAKGTSAISASSPIIVIGEVAKPASGATL